MKGIIRFRDQGKLNLWHEGPMKFYNIQKFMAKFSFLLIKRYQIASEYLLHCVETWLWICVCIVEHCPSYYSMDFLKTIYINQVSTMLSEFPWYTIYHNTHTCIQIICISWTYSLHVVSSSTRFYVYLRPTCHCVTTICITAYMPFC